MNTSDPFADRVMDALGHQTRRDILALLQAGPLPVGALARQLPISRPAVSKHLRILENAGLVVHSSKGASNIFCLSQPGFRAARDYVESFWDEALVRYQRVAELYAEVEGHE